MSEQNPSSDTEGQTPFSGGDSVEFSDTLDTDLRKLQEERDLLFQQMARVQADFQNARRRLESDKQLAIQYANAQLVKSLLPVLDNFERALEVDSEKTDAASLLKGMRIVHDQLVKILGDNDVQVIAPQPGTPFDPNCHEALMQQADSRYNEPVVTQLLQKGYGMHGRTLRAAQVAVSKVE